MNDVPQQQEITPDMVLNLDENVEPSTPDLTSSLSEDLGQPLDNVLVMQRLESIEQQILSHSEKLHQRFDNKLAFDATKQQQIDLLHRELVKYKQDLIAKTIRPLVNGLIQMHDDMGRRCDQFDRTDATPLSPEYCIKFLQEIQEDIEILLDQNGIIAFHHPTDRFEPRRQSVVKSIPAPDAEQVGIIAQRIRPGFEQGEELIKKERVGVYVAIPSSPADDQNTDTANTAAKAEKPLTENING